MIEDMLIRPLVYPHIQELFHQMGSVMGKDVSNDAVQRLIKWRSDFEIGIRLRDVVTYALDKIKAFMLHFWACAYKIKQLRAAHWFICQEIPS
jgi:hypothetical protein